MMAQHPDTLRRFLKAWYETVAFGKSHKAEGIKYSQPETRLTDELASKVYDLEMPTFSLDGRFDPKAVEAVKKAMLELGTVKEAPADKAVFTEEFLPKR
jgi:ABC-type nitrate/sulfonate/bicarbonate transport system substrate-binding protein